MPSRLLSFHALTRLKSIRVVECPEFRQLCMVLRETLTECEIPHRNQVREAIINHWRRSFRDLKRDLSVSWIFVFPLY